MSSLSTRLSYMMKDFRHPPPAEIDPDHPDKRTEQALFSLFRLTTMLQGKSPSTVLTVTENWAQIWPWIHSLARCALDKHPATFLGSEFINQFTAICPVLVTYPTYSAVCGDFRRDLRPLLVASPDILAITVEMWLYTSRTFHSALRNLCDSVGLLLECLLANEDLTRPSESLQVVLQRTNDNMPAISIKGIAFEMSQKPIACERIRSSVIILVHLCQTFGYSTCISKDTARWLALLVKKLSSPRQYWRGSDFEDLSFCLRQGLGMLSQCATGNLPLLASILDTGVVEAIYKAHSIIIEDSQRRNINAPYSLAGVYATFLTGVARHLVYRPILIRIIVNIRAAQKMRTSDDVQLKNCGPALDAWLHLRDEAIRRYEISKRISESEDQAFRICGFTNCPHSDVDLHHVFQRCTGCNSVVYCTRACQKNHWKSGHRNECKTTRRRHQDGFSRLSQLDFAFTHKQCAADYRFSSERVQAAFKEYSEKREVSAGEAVVVLLDYSDYPHKINACTLQECRTRLNGPQSQALSALASAGESPLAYASLPWGEQRPLNIILRPNCLLGS